MISSSKIFKSGTVDDTSPMKLTELLSKQDIIELKQREIEKEEKRVRKDRLEKLEQIAFDKGFTAGEVAGMELAAEKAAPFLKRIEAFFNEANTYKKKFYSGHNKELAEVVGKSVRKIIQTELKVNDDIVASVVKAALKPVLAEKILIKLNPEDALYLTERRPEFLEMIGTYKKFRLVESEDVGKGGCVIESAHGEVDARIEKSLDAFEIELLETEEDES